MAGGRRAARREPPHHTDHAYLWLLGVRPEEQGRGHGSALLRAVLDPADEAGVPAYLEATSSESRRLYEWHGFEVTGEPVLAGGPSLWAMWREPRGWRRLRCSARRRPRRAG